MSYMPVWYQQGRSALLLLQSVIGLLLVSYPLKRRSHFYPRLILSVLAGCAVQYFVRGIYIVGSTPLAMLSHAAAALLVYLTLNAVTWFSMTKASGQCCSWRPPAISPRTSRAP